MELSLKEKTDYCKEIALDKKATNLVVIDIKKHSSVADYFLICSGSSTTQVKAIADDIVEKLKKKNAYSTSVEGYTNGQWILIDYFDLVVHIFHEETREFYSLDKLWEHAEKIINKDQ